MNEPSPSPGAERIGKFFRPGWIAPTVLVILVGLAIAVVGVVILVSGSGDRHVTGGVTIAIFGGVLTLLGVIYFFGKVFPRGCVACNAPFNVGAKIVSLPPESYDAVAGHIERGEGAALAQYAGAAPSKALPIRARLWVWHCPKCEQVGEVMVRLEALASGKTAERMRSTPITPTFDAGMVAVHAVLRARGTEPIDAR